jgi:serine/threonine-protein kinase HipA
MDCGTGGRIANKANIMSGCGRFLLSSEDAQEIFNTITTTVKSEWDPAMRRAGVSEQDCERIARAFSYKGLF